MQIIGVINIQREAKARVFASHAPAQCYKCWKISLRVW